jgi:Tfp pilus assembly protein PilF
LKFTRRGRAALCDPAAQAPLTARGRLPARRALQAASMLVPLFAAGRLGMAAPGPTPDAEAQAVVAPDGERSSAAPPAAPAAPVAPAAPDAAGAATALDVLLEQASFWRGKLQYAQAVASLERALKLAPDSADALALLAEVEMERGDSRAAGAALNRLRRAAPDDARIGRLDQLIRVGAIPPEALTEARRLARGGQQAEALDRYNRMLRGTPPPDALAVEYYQTLAGAEGGYAAGKEGLAQLVRRNPRDLRAQLAYAQTLTYRDDSRLEGIARLAALAPYQAIAGQAAQSWRQALMWLPESKDSAGPLQTYLASHPGDTEVASKLERLRNPAASGDAAGQARVEGFDALNKGRLAEAAKLFQRAIEASNSDADATGGLGLVRLRQRNMADAKTLLARAIALDPAHRNRWQSALAAASATPGGPNPATAMLSRGQFAAAEAELKRQIARTDKSGGDQSPGLLAMLGDAQAGLGELEEAEISYRGVLARAPGTAQALVGLAGVLSREGRGQEASALLAEAAATGNSRVVGQARAQQLRDQASASADPATQAALLRQAVAADPANPWVRLDLARALVRLGATPEARGMMADVTGGAAPGADALRAGVIFANETGDPDTAMALIARLPPSLRTAEMRSLQAQAELQRQIAGALAMSRGAAQQRLLAMATRADPDGARGAAIIRALGRLGDVAAARSAVLAAQAATPGQPPAAALRYAGALLEIGDATGASDMLAQVGAGRGLSGPQHDAFVQLQAGLAVRSSDRLNEQGRQAEAYDRLAPVLAQAPDNPDLNLALARLYQGAKNPAEALQISQSLLRRDPGSTQARKSAVEAALQLGDRRLADRLAQEAVQLAPNDPQSWIMASEVAKAGDDKVRALRDLEHARALRQQQIGSADGAGGAGAAGRGALPGMFQQPAGAPADLSLPPLLQQRAIRAAPPPQPLPPFVRQQTNAVGDRPSYQPASADPPLRRLFEPADDDAALPKDVAIAADQTNRDPAADAGGAVVVAQNDQPPAVPEDGPSYPVSPFRNPDNLVPQALPAPFPAEPQPALRAPGSYDNPFRPNPVDPLAAPAPAAPPDPETAEIDRSIATLRDLVAPSVQTGFGFRNRSGDSGLDALNELTLPMEATYTPGGVGQLKLTATPTILTAGTLGGGITNQQRFGSNALLLRPPVPGNASSATTLAGAAPGDQSAGGIGLGLAWAYRSLTADVGATPLGFREQNVVGGLEWAPQITDHTRLRLTAERREVSDSLLSYGGTVDPRTGEVWGGVTRNHGRANLEFSAGRANFYVGGGGAELGGSHVANNTEAEAGAGGSFPVYATATQAVRLGLDLVYFSYQKNLRFFTLGQGGYFSPQSFYAAMIPVNYKEQVDEDLSYEVGGSLGFESYRENASPYYPLDPGFQAQLVAQQANPATAVPGVVATYASRGQSGIAGTAHASADYRVTPSLHVGGKVTYQYSPNFNETTALVYARYLFNGADK